MQNLHREQKGALSGKQTIEALREAQRQRDADQRDVQGWRAALAAIKERQATGGPWYRLRHAERDQEQAAGLQRNLDHAAQQRAAETRALDLAQHREQAALELKIWQEQQERSREAGEPSAYERLLQQREAFESRDRDEGRDRERDFER